MTSGYTLRAGIILLCTFNMIGCNSTETPSAVMQENNAAMSAIVDENISTGTNDGFAESPTVSNTAANDLLANPAHRTINFSNYQDLLSELFRVANKEYINDINTRVSTDLGSPQPGLYDHQSNDEIVRVSGTDQYDCVLGGSLHQPPSAYELGEITLSNCVVGAHTYNGFKDWNTSGRSGGSISYENLTALNHDGVSGFSIDGRYSSSFTNPSSSTKHYYNIVELTDIEGVRTTVRDLSTNYESRSDSIKAPGQIYYNTHEFRDGTFVNLNYSSEHKYIYASFTFQSPLSNNQIINFSLDFSRDYGFYTDSTTQEAVHGVDIRTVYNSCCEEARGSWFTPGPPPDGDRWLQGGIELNATDGSMLVISLNPDDKNYLFIHINDVEEPIVTQWSELERLGLSI